MNALLAPLRDLATAESGERAEQSAEPVEVEIGFAILWIRDQDATERMPSTTGGVVSPRG